jgi:hypothetical protein
MTNEDVHQVSGEPERSAIRSLEGVAALSGIFLVVAYVSGRIYLSAYYAAFHVEIAQLGLSVQDVMFGSITSLASPILTVAFLIITNAWLRRFYQLGTQIEHARERADELLATHGRVHLAMERIEKGEEIGQEIHEKLEDDLRSIDAKHDDLRSELDAIEGISRQADEELGLPLFGFARRMFARFGEPPRWLSTGLAVPPLIIASLVSLALIGCTIGVLMPLRGFESALYDGLAVALIYLTGYAVFLLAEAVARRARLTVAHQILALALLLHIVLVLPFGNGRLLGLASREDSSEPGRGLPEVELISSEPLDQTWVLDDGQFRSPPLRQLGQTATFVVLWDPSEPGGVQSIRITSIVRIEGR